MIESNWVKRAFLKAFTITIITALCSPCITHSPYQLGFVYMNKSESLRLGIMKNIPCATRSLESACLRLPLLSFRLVILPDFVQEIRFPWRSFGYGWRPWTPRQTCKVKRMQRMERNVEGRSIWIKCITLCDQTTIARHNDFSSWGLKVESKLLYSPT